MTHYVYQGDPLKDGDGPPVITAFGVRFERGQPVQVQDAAIGRKLDANGHFEKVDGRRMGRKQQDVSDNGDVHEA